MYMYMYMHVTCRAELSHKFNLLDSVLLLVCTLSVQDIHYWYIYFDSEFVWLMWEGETLLRVVFPICGLVQRCHVELCGVNRTHNKDIIKGTLSLTTMQGRLLFSLPLSLSLFLSLSLSLRLWRK